jgi:hypothetical protein
MRLRGVLLAGLPSLLLLSGLSATLPLPGPDIAPSSEDVLSVGKRTARKQQEPGHFREYPAWEYNDYPIPADSGVPGEWAFARFMYRAIPTWRGRLNNWTIDYPRSDRHLSAAVRRLTLIQARSVEEPVAAEDGDDIYNWPWLYAVEVGHWDLTDLQAAKLRDFLDRGGFFMCDDFHGTMEWETFAASMKKVFPDRAIVDLPSSDAIFHTVYDLDDRYQVPGEQFVYRHQTYEKDGFHERWRGIYDDRGRVMVAICHNMDLGDSWEHADNPMYPEEYSALGFRIGVNYLVYSMTH